MTNGFMRAGAGRRRVAGLCAPFCLALSLSACATAEDAAQPIASALELDDAGADTEPSDANFALRVVTLGLEAPYEVLWGPDGMLWVSERVGKRVVRVDPQTGARIPALAVTDAVQTGGQDGVLGMVLHPQLLKGQGNDYVYLAYTYTESAAMASRTKIVRYTYDAASQSLTDPQPLLQGLPASTDHNSAKLVFAPDDTLYYTIGDQGGKKKN